MDCCDRSGVVLKFFFFFFFSIGIGEVCVGVVGIKVNSSVSDVSDDAELAINDGCRSKQAADDEDAVVVGGAWMRA
jgi:hypothetical protein